MYRLTVFFLFSVPFVCSIGAQPLYTAEDTVIFRRFSEYAKQGDIDIIQTALFFTDTPYVGGTLEGDSVERLRVNLHEFDCTTFSETVIALYLTQQSDDPSFRTFCDILQRIRYRDGILNGYLSRLHYASDWLDNNRQKGIFSLSKLSQCQTFVPDVSFMSTHCDKYPALNDRPGWCKAMKETEKQVNALRICYIPKDRVKASEPELRNGDIIVITTHIKGLDAAHMGFALVRNGSVYLLHASSEAKKVIVTGETLHEYLARRKNHSGIIVARTVTDEK